jgi:pimeloyl-ACP methyl ester carboxylesterase
MRPLLLAALLLPAPALADSFVLVNGAFGGAWTWEEVTPLLEAAGHTVTAVELKGLGARYAEMTPEVSVEDHVADITAAIDAAYEESGPPVILVAHSYGGRPATGAWDLDRDRLAHVVWIEAPAPLADTGLPPDGESLSFVVMMYPDVADSGLMPPPPVRAGTYDHPLTAMSLKALYGPVPFRNGPLPTTPGTFIYGETSSLPGLRRLGEALRDRLGWDLVALPGGHDLPMESPEALAQVLLEVADGTP